ncbi:hypothetical protein GTY56_12265 [Streptomyces sp. SID5643]|nr:hypothetical protein [Streptomyces sp. SID5643]
MINSTGADGPQDTAEAGPSLQGAALGGQYPARVAPPGRPLTSRARNVPSAAKSRRLTASTAAVGALAAAAPLTVMADSAAAIVNRTDSTESCRKAVNRPTRCRATRPGPGPAPRERNAARTGRCGWWPCVSPG